jgi:hypothetical protein
MKYLKTFESFSGEETNEGLGDLISGKSAYKRTVEFIEGGKEKKPSEEAKQILAIYKEIRDSKKPETDAENKTRMQKITALGQQWAKANKMDVKDYAYSSIRTVLEEDYNRKFKGGPDLIKGE